MNRLAPAAFKRLTAALLLATLLAACGGGEDVAVGGGAGGTTPPPAPGGTAVGATGGTISLSGGPSVLVPAGALASATAVLIERVTTGAPAMPTDMAAAGDLYAITPHGTSFQQPVIVTLPVPNVSLAANQQMMMAKAEPNGSWIVLGDTVISGSTAAAPVSEFSFFTMVIITYPQGFVQAAPFALTSSSIACSNQDCNGFIGRTTATYTYTANNGQLPSGCFNPEIQIGAQGASGFSFTAAAGFAGGSGTASFSDRVFGAIFLTMRAELRCAPSAGGTRRITAIYGSNQLYASGSAGNSYPDIRVDRAPAQLDVVNGNAATLEMILSGGAAAISGSGTLTYAAPTTVDRAVMDWQRSDDQGRSWQTFARSYQNEGGPAPLNGEIPWRHWTSSHTFIASSGDHGALMRVIACYTPPAGTAPPPCATGASTRINVIQQAALPVVTSTSESMLVQSGQSATLVAVATGLPAPTLQWQSRPANAAGPWSSIAGATSASYVTPTLSAAQNGTQYRVVASNTLGAANGPVTIVSVSDLAVAPFITTQPANLLVTAGSDAAFAVAVRGTEVLSYQWKKGATPIAGATSAVLRLGTVSSGDAGSYSVSITNAAGNVTSTAATLAVTSATTPAVAPTIVTQPAALTVSAGNSATFAVGVNGTGPFTYQWRKDGAPIGGATSAAYTLGSISAGDAATYSVVVGNGAGSVTSNAAMLTLASPGLPPVTTPLIVTNPSTVVVAAGASATLAAQATGSAPLSYQWSKSGTPIGGATSAVLVLNPVTTMDAGSYTVTVSNAAGSATSSSADIILLGAPVITVQPQAATTTAGSTATFSVTATGQALHYAWLRNGVEITGATGASYTTPTLLLSEDGALYSVTVYNGSGLKFSNAARLTVNQAPPSALGYASPQSYPTGSAIATLSPTVTGAVTGYSVAPALPAGLSLNTSNGAITGTPTAATAQSTYRITATGPGGSANFDLVLTITAPATGTSLTWTTPLRLDTGSLDIMNPQVAVDAAGNAMAVWMQWDGSIWSVWATRYTVAGNSWAPPTQIQLDLSSRAQDPKLVMDGAGNAFATWYQDGSPSSVWAARFDAAAGTWDTALPLQTFLGNPLLPDIAADNAGNAVAVWWNIDDGGGMRLVQRQYDVASHSWGTLSLNNADIARNRIGYPEVKFLPGNSTALVIWSQQSVTGVNEVRSSTITIGTGVGATWNATSSRVASTFVSRARIAVDPNGIVTAVFANGTAVGASRLDTNIVNPLWTAPVAIEYASGDVADRARVAVDAAGNAIAVWEETAPGNVMRSVARRFNVATDNWEAGVTFISTTTGNGGFPSVRFDATGNAIAMLNSDTVFNSSNIYARRFAAGSWESDDSRVSLAVSPNSAVTPEFVLGASGKALAVWRQQTGSNTAAVYFSRNP